MNNFLKKGDEKMIKELLEILKKELDIYQELLKVSNEKTDIVKEDKTSELDQLVRQEEILIAKVVELEKKRIRILKEICVNLRLKEESISISDLSQYVDEKQELLEMKEKITKTLKELKRANELNTKLVENSLEYINFSVNLATGADKESITYEQKGQTNTKGHKNIFDIKL